MRFAKSDGGSAPTLAIFTILVVLSSTIIITHLQEMDEKEISSIRLSMASDITRATAKSMRKELDDTLSTAVVSAMHDVGAGSGNTAEVEEYIIGYLNRRIDKGWKYPNIAATVPRIDENSIAFEWKADGSLKVKVHLNSKLEHVKGPKSFGCYLEKTIRPRFKRIRHLTSRIKDMVKKSTSKEIPELEESLNENYKYECLKIDLTLENSRVEIEVFDIYGSRVVYSPQ